MPIQQAPKHSYAQLLFLLFFFGGGEVQAQNHDTHTKKTSLMGSAFAFTAVHHSPEKAELAVKAAITEVERIERLISSWNPDSETSEINQNAGIRPIEVSQELFQLIKRSKKISTLSDGYFDISFSSIDKIWNFNQPIILLPDSEQVQKSLAKINYQHIILDEKRLTILLKKQGMKIGFGAIGKGYAADRAKVVMQKMGIESGLVNAGGDLICWGRMTDHKNWSIGIKNPKDKKQIVSWLDISNTAVVTSGNYEKYIEINGERYCHIINPKTGWPVKGLSSVTILCASAELADALATTVFVLGKAEGLQLINRLKGIECIIINDKGESFYSKNVEKRFFERE